MKKNKIKENLISILTLCGIFGLFVYFQFGIDPNTKINDNSSVIIGEEKPKVIDISNKDQDLELAANDLDALENNNLNNSDNPNEIIVEIPSNRELIKAKMYLDRTWAADKNCEQEWIDYLRSHPDAFNVNNELLNQTANIKESNQEEVVKVSSNE